MLHKSSCHLGSTVDLGMDLGLGLQVSLACQHVMRGPVAKSWVKQCGFDLGGLLLGGSHAPAVRLNRRYGLKLVA